MIISLTRIGLPMEKMDHLCLTFMTIFVFSPLKVLVLGVFPLSARLRSRIPTRSVVEKNLWSHKKSESMIYSYRTSIWCSVTRSLYCFCSLW